ncbi:Transposase [Plantibacter sp. RU18]
MRRTKNAARQDSESLEDWLRRRVAEPGNGIPIDPRMTLDLYDRLAALESRVRDLESRGTADTDRQR